MNDNTVVKAVSVMIVTSVSVMVFSIGMDISNEMAEGIYDGSEPVDPQPFDIFVVVDALVWITPKLIAVGVAVWLGRRAYRRRTYPWGATGVNASVRESPLEESGLCVNCWTDSEDVVALAYGRDYVLLGVVVWRRTDGTVVECESCREADELEYAARAADPVGQAVQEGAA